MNARVGEDMIKKLLAAMIIVIFINVLVSDTKAKALMSPYEMLGIVTELLEEYTAQEERLSNEDNSIFQEKKYDDSVGRYANPAGMDEVVNYEFTIQDGESKTPIDMQIQAKILLGDDAYRLLGMNEAYQVFDQMNPEEEWIIIEFEVVTESMPVSEATFRIKSSDFDLYIANSPDTSIYEPIYNDDLFEVVELQPGDRFKGNIAKRVPKYTDLLVRFGIGEESNHVFWYYNAEEDPNIMY